MARRREPRGIQARMDRLEAHAHQTMNAGEQAIIRLEALVSGAIEDVQDGVDFELLVAGKVIPVTLRMKLRQNPPERKEP